MPGDAISLCKLGSSGVREENPKQGIEYWKGFKPLLHVLVETELVVIFQGDDLGITTDSLMKTSAQCVVAVKKASKVLGCIEDRTIWKNITACISPKGSSMNICYFISTFKKVTD